MLPSFPPCHLYIDNFRVGILLRCRSVLPHYPLSKWEGWLCWLFGLFYVLLLKVLWPVVCYFLSLGALYPLTVLLGMSTRPNDGYLSKVRYLVIWVRPELPERLNFLPSLSDSSHSVDLWCTVSYLSSVGGCLSWDPKLSPWWVCKLFPVYLRTNMSLTDSVPFLVGFLISFITDLGYIPVFITDKGSG